MGTFCSTDRGDDSDDHEKEMASTASPNTKAHAPGVPKDLIFDFQKRPNVDARKETGEERRARKALEELEEAAEKQLAQWRLDDERVHFKSSSSADRFTNISHIVEKTKVFKAAQMMPKGAHLHIHFNSNLLPQVLLDYAAEMPNMFIWSSNHQVTRGNLQTCKIEFHIRSLDEKVKGLQQTSSDAAAMRPESDEEKMNLIDEYGPSLYREGYVGNINTRLQNEMRYQHFRKLWGRLWEEDDNDKKTCDEWLISKLILGKEQVDSFYADDEKENIPVRDRSDLNLWPAAMRDDPECDLKMPRLSASRAWDAFNARTKMMKGLFNYEKAYKGYTRQCLEEFARDNVQYAEIRPNFMPNNYILKDEGKDQIKNDGILKLIVDEYEKFMRDIRNVEDKNGLAKQSRRPALSGLKVIYCTPRSFGNDPETKDSDETRGRVQIALDECIEMKKDPKYGKYIAGFDLVGEEAYPYLYPLSHYRDQFTDFKRKCKAENLEIPFLFHCGETFDDKEGNLEVALEFRSRRIGHGYALPKKPRILQKMRDDNVCVEACPISNMILGLAPTMAQHSIYWLLKEKMPCTLSTDNGTLFKSTLSHDFYEVMVGHQNINLQGWKKLALWSIEHACLDDSERKAITVEWLTRWKEFLEALNDTEMGEMPRYGETPPHQKQLEALKKKEAREGKCSYTADS